MMTFVYATVPHLMAKAVEQITDNWEGFVGSLSHRIGRKEGPAVVFATFDEPRRLARHVTGITALALDVDEGANVVEVYEKLLELRLAGVIWTTHSHTEAEHRFRVVCPLAEALPVRAHRIALDMLGNALGIEWDKQCADPCRLFLLPACPATARDSAIIVRAHGQPLTIEQFVLRADIAERDALLKASKRKVGPTFGDAQTLLNKAARSVLESDQRNVALNRWAFILGKAARRGELAISEAESVLMDAALDAGLSRAEAGYTLRRALHQGGVV